MDDINGYEIVFSAPATIADAGDKWTSCKWGHLEQISIMAVICVVMNSADGMM